MHLAEPLLHRGPSSHAPGSLGPGLRDLGLLPPPAASPHHLLGCPAAASPVPAGPSAARPLGHPVAAFFPRLLRPFGVPAKVQSPFLLGPGTRGREGGERRVPHFPLDARVQTTRAMRRWALRLGKAAGILPRPGVFSVGVGVLRRACWGAPRTAGSGARAEQEPGWRPRFCIRRRCYAAECHLRDTCQPAGSRRRAPPDPASSVPGTEGASPRTAGGGLEHCPRREAGGVGRPPEPPPPPLPLFRCSAAANHVPSVTQRL